MLPSLLGRVPAVHRHCMLYPGICLVTEGKRFMVVEKSTLGIIHCATWPPFRVARTSFRSRSRYLGEPFQRSDSINKGFPTSANFELDLSDI